jgi:serine/threonine-protein kinase HipA
MNPKMARAAEIRFMGTPAGRLWEDQDGYHFAYDTAYIAAEHAKAISLTLPIRPEPYVSRTMFPFFDGLIPEGWLLEIAELNWKLNPRDRMGLLLTCCKDCIGAVSVHPIETTAP